MKPKFRVWLKTKKRMVGTGDLLVIDYDLTQIMTQQVFFERGLAVERDIKYYDFEDIELMQSTGLFDKNNKEIFEGDVVRQVRTQPTTENEIIIGVVTMLEGAWLIMNDGEQLVSQLWSETDENEIIGNVYENKDILEVKE